LTPYYQDNRITIFHGDCRELLPEILRARDGVPFDLCMTDPPYGINYSRGFSEGAKLGRNTLSPTKFAGDASRCAGDERPFDPWHMVASLANEEERGQEPETAEEFVLWGANNYARALPFDSGGWFIWDKRCNISSNDGSDAELAWTTLTNSARIFYHVWDGFRRDTQKDKPRIHPMEKPVALWSWCLRFAPGASEIIDPYCGSGSSLRAAKNAGLSAVGIDIEERWCAAAAEEARQEAFTFA